MTNQAAFYPPEHSLIATTIEIKAQYYDEIIDLGKLFPAITKTQKEEFFETISPHRVNSIRKSFMSKPERERFGNNTTRQTRLLPRLRSPNSERDRKISRKLQKANATLQTTLIPIARLQQYTKQKN
jgi:hypothetical protein